jgi:hypothetical protein
METFVVISLILLLIVVQHLANWIYRKAADAPFFDSLYMLVFTTILYGIATYCLLKYIILWGYPILK